MNFYHQDGDGEREVLALDLGEDKAAVQMTFNCGSLWSTLVMDEEINEYSPLARIVYLDVGGGEYQSLAAIIREAKLQYDNIMNEINEAREDEKAMDKELSSPYLTGRV